MSFEPVLPVLLAGATTAGAAVPPNGGLKLAKNMQSVCTAFGKPAGGESPLQARAARAYADLLEVTTMVQGVSEKSSPSPKASGLTSVT